MAFSIQCSHKGCQKLQAPYIDLTNSKVYCSLCDGELTVTQFVMHQMKMNKQFRKKEDKSFSIKCPQCGKEDRPTLSGKDILCSGCKKPMNHLTEQFKIMLREQLPQAGKDVV